MTKNMINICNKVIEYSFYALFFLVPLVFAGNTSELFELNKMWLAWGLTIVIGASWLTKMILQGRILLCRTPLDIPILLFLSSQVLSTIFSWDRHISFWGYYSRFNGGLLSTITYLFLYYAFISNIGTIKVVWRILFVSLISGLIVGLWGLPSHFGYDPTCFIFRGTFDVSCWTADFQPRARIFSTLGQPAWLAAYLAVLIPIAIVFFINETRNMRHGTWSKFLVACFLLLVALFYVDLLFTSTRAGVLGLWLSLIFLFIAYIWIRRNNIKSAIINIPLLILLGTFIIVTFIISNPIPQIYNFTLPGLRERFTKTQVANTPEKPSIQDQSQPSQSQKSTKQPQTQTSSGGTESGNIRLLVWQGALEAWKNNPIFGTGVETFAFAYYKYKPVGQNSVSEWNFLYNKAHNEYVNYLATTGTFGIGSYILMIAWFLFLVFRHVILRQQAEGSRLTRDSSSRQVGTQNDKPNNPLIPALVAGYLSILITNFFGFSVVIMNLYLFLIPAFVLVMGGMIPQKKIISPEKVNLSMSIWQWTPVFLILITSLYMLFTLYNYWRADVSYALGYNLNRTSEYQEAYKNLHRAVELRKEPIFQDELAVNDAILAVALLSDPSKKDDPQTITTASSLAQEAVSISDQIVFRSPKNIVFWKSRVRLFFTLSQVDGRYLPKALEAIEKAALLAPNDANILYNLGVLYGQNNKIAKGIEILEKTIALKPDYTDAHYALGLFYHSLSMDEAQKVVVDKALNEKAIAQMQYILTNISSTHTPAKDAIRDWTQ